MNAAPAPQAAADSLYVACGERIVGTLRRDAAGAVSFRYAREWLDGGFAISLSLPLADTTYEVAARRFFVNLLPEGIIRRRVARRLGISEDNDWELLAALGGDCAGALSVTPEPPAERRASYRELSPQELHALAAEPHPGLAGVAGDRDVRLSLAGAQDKLPLRVTGSGEYLLPRGSAASSHIIKFGGEDYAHLTANEVFVTRLARGLDLPVPDAVLDPRFDPPLCVVERYDRREDDAGKLHRLHQEDFCQALGLPPSRKYETEGGPDIGMIAAAIERHCADPVGDLRSLIRWLAFCVIAGNADGHAKNLSLLYDGAAPRLAPFYDLLSTRVYPGISRRLALSVAGASDPGQIARSDWIRLGEQLDVRPSYVVELVDELTTAVPDALEDCTDAFADAYGDLPVLQMVPPAVLRQSRRTRKLLQASSR